MASPPNWSPGCPCEKETLHDGDFSCCKVWSMSDGTLGELLEKPRTAEDIGLLPDKDWTTNSWGAHG